MTRRLHPCLTCTGRTRHRAACGPCRRRGVTVVGDQVTVPLVITDPTVRRSGRLSFGPSKVVLLPATDTPHAPTLAEISRAGIDLGTFISYDEEGHP